ncbi:MAG TPA: FAD-binding oxidoreductase [Dongiaceae bacterium]|nr:FAD-binding oxidoreductase [Dongiaceae bacterium]
MAEKHLAAQIVDRRDVATDLFVLKVELAGELPFVAGQYATLGVELDGKRIERPYSLCSSPYDQTLEFFVERVQNGELTPLLYAMDKGAPLLVRRFAKGRFTLDLRSGRKNHFLLGTVTGIAPYVSYIRTIYHDWKTGDAPMPGEHHLFCVQGASRAAEFGYRDELERIASEVPWLKYAPTVSRPWESPEWQGETGRVDDLIRGYARMWKLKPEDTTAYLCGHPGMVESGRGILFRAGWKKDAVQDEVYFVPGRDVQQL